MSNENIQKRKRNDGRETYRIECKHEECDFDPVARGWLAATLVEEEHEDETGHEAQISDGRDLEFRRATEVRNE